MKLATLCYIRKDNKTLMLYRNKKKNDYHKGKWNGIGGKFEAGESPEECAKREILEETGLRVKKLQLHGTITFPLFDGKDDWYCWIFSCTDFDGQVMSDPPEGELKWIANNDLMGLNLWPGDRVFIPWTFKKEIFSGKFIYENGEFVNHFVHFYPELVD